MCSFEAVRSICFVFRSAIWHDVFPPTSSDVLGLLHCCRALSGANHKDVAVTLVPFNDWQALSAAPLRLVGAGASSANVGLIQVQSEGGSFGTVCGLNVAAADVACRQLGGAP